MLPAAIECVVETGQASTSLLQRKLKLGYARAARIIDEMGTAGLSVHLRESKPRQVLISRQQWIEMKMQEDGHSPSGKGIGDGRPGEEERRLYDTMIPHTAPAFDRQAKSGFCFPAAAGRKEGI